MKNNYLLAAKDNSWSNALNEKLNILLKNYNFDRVCTRKELNQYLKLNNPKKIFFFHWSYIVSFDIYDSYECIVFHTANLSDFRGGSPLQNQIIKNITHSQVNALKMVSEIDAGPIYCKKSITLQGTIYDIWHTITATAFLLIKEIIENPNLKPIEQEGNVAFYNRLKKNNIPFESDDLNAIYRFIQMLDAEE